MQLNFIAIPHSSAVGINCIKSCLGTESANLFQFFMRRRLACPASSAAGCAAARLTSRAYSKIPVYGQGEQKGLQDLHLLDGLLARGRQDAQCPLGEHQEDGCRGSSPEGQGDEGGGAGDATRKNTMRLNGTRSPAYSPKMPSLRAFIMGPKNSNLFWDQDLIFDTNTCSAACRVGDHKEPPSICHQIGCNNPRCNRTVLGRSGLVVNRSRLLINRLGLVQVVASLGSIYHRGICIGFRFLQQGFH
jgi:hypothetical protein